MKSVKKILTTMMFILFTSQSAFALQKSSYDSQGLSVADYIDLGLIGADVARFFAAVYSDKFYRGENQKGFNIAWKSYLVLDAIDCLLKPDITSRGILAYDIYSLFKNKNVVSEFSDDIDITPALNLKGIKLQTFLIWLKNVLFLMDSTFSIVDKLTFPLQSKISYVSYGANVFNGYGILSSKVIDQETKIDVFEGMNYSLKNMAEFLRKEFSGLSYADISVIFKILARSIDTKNCKIVSKKGIAFVLLPILGAFLKNYYNPQLADEIEGNVQRGLSYLCVAKKNLFSWTNILGIKTKKDAKNFNTYQSEYFTYEKINFEDICNSMINDIEKYNTYNDTIKNKAISKINRFKDAFKEMIKDDEYDFITAYNKWLAGKTKTFEYKAWKGSTCEYKEISYDTLIADKDVYKYIKEINELKNKEEEKF